jgi:hypothetical protein
MSDAKQSDCSADPAATGMAFGFVGEKSLAIAEKPQVAPCGRFRGVTNGNHLPEKKSHFDERGSNLCVGYHSAGIGYSSHC